MDFVPQNPKQREKTGVTAMVTPVSCPFGWLFPLSKHLPYRGRPEGLSFYYSLVYLSTKALNSVEAFDYALCDGELVRLGGQRPSFTDLKKGSDNFHIVTLPMEESMAAFCAAAGKKAAARPALSTKARAGWI